MNEIKTISDSKKEFHQTFTHVIPPIYRRITDELLVELHLLSHQRGFKRDTLFCVGLIKVFEEFTKGYKPQEHLDKLFKAICKSNLIDPNEISEKSRIAKAEIEQIELEEIIKTFNSKGGQNVNEQYKVLKELLEHNNSYSRITGIGLYTLLGFTKKSGISREELKEEAIKIGESIGFTSSRLKKDLNMYTSNIEKIGQAIELMKETIESQRKKREMKSKEKELNPEIKLSFI